MHCVRLLILMGKYNLINKIFRVIFLHPLFAIDLLISPSKVCLNSLIDGEHFDLFTPYFLRQRNNNLWNLDNLIIF